MFAYSQKPMVPSPNTVPYTTPAVSDFKSCHGHHLSFPGVKICLVQIPAGAEEGKDKSLLSQDWTVKNTSSESKCCMVMCRPVTNSSGSQVENTDTPSKPCVVCMTFASHRVRLNKAKTLIITFCFTHHTRVISLHRT